MPRHPGTPDTGKSELGGRLDLALPELPPGWTFHVGISGYQEPRFVLTLCDATVYERIAFTRENPGQAKEGTGSYEQLLSNGVRVVQARDVKGWKRLRKRAEKMAESAWIVHHARERLDRRDGNGR